MQYRMTNVIKFIKNDVIKIKNDNFMVICLNKMYFEYAIIKIF